MEKDAISIFFDYVPYVLGSVFSLGVIGLIVTARIQSKNEKMQKEKEQQEINELEALIKKEFSGEEAKIARLFICKKYNLGVPESNIYKIGKNSGIPGHRIEEIESYVQTYKNP